MVVVSGDHSVHMLTCGDGCRCLHVGRNWLQAYQEWQGPGLVAGLGAVHEQLCEPRLSTFPYVAVGTSHRHMHGSGV